MSKVKEQVLEYLQTDRTLLGGRNLYNNLPGKSLALQNSFARMTNTPANVSKVHYELAKHVGIPERQLNIYLQKPLVDKVAAKKEEPPVKKELSLKERLLSSTTITLDYNAAKVLVKELKIKPKSRKKADIYQALTDAREKELDKQLSELPIEVKASIKLRDQFPFLREDNCPDSLKLLVSDLITSYEKFKEAQPKLHEVLPTAEAKALGDFVLENYIDNKMAWAELEHYKATGNILGEHPLFERLEAKEEISAMNAVDLAKKIKNLEINIGKNKKKENTELVARDEDLLAHAKEVLAKR